MRVASLLFLRTAAAAVSAVHLGLSSYATQLFVQWTLSGAPSNARVEYGASAGALTSTATGTAWSWTDSSSGRVYHHAMATLTGLTPGARFYYKAGDDAAFSAVTAATATRAPAQFSQDAPLRIGWLGDLGVANAQALPYLVNETGLDMFIHVGGACSCAWRAL